MRRNGWGGVGGVRINEWILQQMGRRIDCGSSDRMISLVCMRKSYCSICPVDYWIVGLQPVEAKDQREGEIRRDDKIRDVLVIVN